MATLCLFFIAISQFICTSAQSNSYIVHMDLSAMPKAYSDHHNWYMATLASATDNLKVSTTSAATSSSSVSSKMIYSYTNVIHGFSAVLSNSELETIKRSPGYVSSTRDATFKLDTTHTSKFLGLDSNYGAWPASDYGKDVIIGVIDSGVWPESKSYDDYGFSEIPSRWKGACDIGTQFNSSMCNKKLIGARYFNKGLLAGDPTLNISMNSARDTDGHGTHTSSTAAGNYVEGASYFGYASGTAVGVAPKARVAIYKVFFDEGSTSSDVLAAIDQAIEDGVDVLSISLGYDLEALYEDQVAIATFAALEKGIFVSTSAGNDGPDIKSIHNGTPWVLTVASGSLDREFLGNIILENGVTVTGQSLYPGNLSSNQYFPLVFKDKCDINEKELKKIAKKIVVCINTDDILSDQVSTVRSSNASGGVFITNSSDLRSSIQSSFPTVFVNLEDGKIILDYIKKNNKNSKASFEFRKTRLGTKPAPKVATSSSRGPSASCPFVLKPDIIGPGQYILAAWPENVPASSLDSTPIFSNFNVLSGTSMSCPHLAGVAALLKGAHPEWSPAAIRSAMMTTSYVLDNTLKPIQDKGNDNKPATPLDYGAGHINPNKALDPGLIYEVNVEDYINLICALNFTKIQMQTITRSASYNCSNPSLDLNYPSFIAYFNADDTNSSGKIVQEFHRTVTNVGDGMAIYSAKLTPMNGLEVKVVPDKLEFKAKHEKQSYKLSIKGPRRLQKFLVDGSISWVENGGKHVVRSPIVATSLSSEILGAGGED